MKKFFLLVFIASMFICCARIKEKRAEHHQPFKPHKDKKGHKQQHHPQHHPQHH